MLGFCNLFISTHSDRGMPSFKRQFQCVHVPRCACLLEVLSSDSSSESSGDGIAGDVGISSSRSRSTCCNAGSFAGSLLEEPKRGILKKPKCLRKRDDVQMIVLHSPCREDSSRHPPQATPERAARKAPLTIRRNGVMVGGCRRLQLILQRAKNVEVKLSQPINAAL